MANSFTVTPATLRSKASELRQQNGKLKTEIGNLTSQESTLNSMWDGPANDAFHKSFDSDINQMNNFYTAIENYTKALEQIANEYEKTENANQNVASTRNYK